MPTRRIRSACCARTASGQERQDAAALQSSVINSRRFIASPEAQDKASYQVEFAMSALGQKQTYAVQRAKDEDVIRTSASSFCRDDRRRTVTKIEWRNVG